jgi:hypothetical protein
VATQRDGDWGRSSSGTLSLSDRRRESEGTRRWARPVLREKRLRGRKLAHVEETSLVGKEMGFISDE